MGIYNTAKSYAKGLCISGLVLGALALGSGNASAEKQMDSSIAMLKSKAPAAKSPTIDDKLPERKIALDFTNPLVSAEANTKAWYSHTQLFGKLNDSLGLEDDPKWDDTLLGRSSLLGISYLLNDVFSTWSHEYAHAREIRKYGDFEFDWRNDQVLVLSDLTDEQDLKSTIAGINQEEFNAYFLIKNNANSMTFDNALLFLTSKWSDWAYSRIDTEDTQGDVVQFIDLFNKKGIKLSQKDYEKQALIADAFSFQTYDSLRTIWNYLAKGERETAMTTFKIGNTKFTPPLISCYLTPDGSFYNITSFMNPDSKNSVELSIGTDVDFIGDGNVNMRRLGGQYNNISLDKWLKLSPFIHLSSYKKTKRKGISVGTEASVPLYKKLLLTGKVEYNRNDALENKVKGEDAGVNWTLGTALEF